MSSSEVVGQISLHPAVVLSLFNLCYGGYLSLMLAQLLSQEIS